MNAKRFTVGHFVLFLIIAHLGGFRITHVYEGTRENLYKIVEMTRAIEAFTSIGLIREKIEYCYTTDFESYENCLGPAMMAQFNNSPNTHFEYEGTYDGGQNFLIRATRNTLHGGDPTNRIFLRQKDGKIFRKGEGLYWFVF